MMIVPGILGSIPPVAPATFYLPVTAGLHRAWSFRRLRAAYTGPCLRARRTSDNKLLDIGFSLGVMDAASLSSFLAGADGRLHTLYDQAGAINLAQTALLQQPRIATAGVPVTGLNNRHGYTQVAANTEHILSGSDTSLASFTAFAVGCDMSGGN
ncbi:MAG: arabinofuranosidase catalytic domain-containing protein, partial [Bacteroidota bacterium]